MLQQSIHLEFDAESILRYMFMFKKLLLFINFNRQIQLWLEHKKNQNYNIKASQLFLFEYNPNNKGFNFSQSSFQLIICYSLIKLILKYLFCGEYKIASHLLPEICSLNSWHSKKCATSKQRSLHFAYCTNISRYWYIKDAQYPYEPFDLEIKTIRKEEI